MTPQSHSSFCLPQTESRYLVHRSCLPRNHILGSWTRLQHHQMWPFALQARQTPGAAVLVHFGLLYLQGTVWFARESESIPQGLRVREPESGQVSDRHDVSFAECLHQRLLRVAAMPHVFTCSEPPPWQPGSGRFTSARGAGYLRAGFRCRLAEDSCSARVLSSSEAVSKRAVAPASTAW